MLKRSTKILSLILAAVMVFSLLPVSALAAGADERATWAIYIYLCGSNLESDSGCATLDILEILKAQVPKNVKIVAFTGGAKAWDPYGHGAQYNARVRRKAYLQPEATRNQLFLIDDEGMTLLKSYDGYLNMNEVDTAKLFLHDAMAAAPAEHIMVEFWDHGGAVFGFEQDEYSKKMLSLSDLREIMKEAAALNGGKKIDLVGFDACLMSTLEIGSTLAPYADYMLASEEIEPGYGWDYRFLNLFGRWKGSQPPTAVDLGKAIIDNYAYSLNSNGDWSQSTEYTLALTDLSKMDKLQGTFDAFAETAIQAMKEDVDVYVQLARIGEKAQTSSVGTYSCMVDLYDFMFRAREIAPLAAAADKVIEVLGAPTGSKEPGYTDHVSPRYYVGATVGDGPAVVYRGTSYAYNNSVGLSFFYPTSSSGLPPARFAPQAAKYGISTAYHRYLTAAGELPEKVTFFSGQLKASYDEAEGMFVLNVQPAQELEALSRVDYVTTYTEADEDMELVTYLLGSEMHTDGWEDDHFTQAPYGTWYSMAGHLITVLTDNYFDNRELSGTEVYTYTIPAMVTDGNGAELMVEMSAIETLADKIDKGDPNGFMYGKLLVTAINPISSVRPGSNILDARAPAERGLYPGDIVSIRPALAILDMDSQKIIGYEVADETVKFERLMKDTQLYALPVETVAFVSGPTTSYSSYFKVTDLYQNTYLSDPFYYIITNEFSDCQIGVIPPVAYTGASVEPKVRLLYHGMEMFTQGVDYAVSYANNVDKGTANVTVTSLIAGLPGTLTATFTICDQRELIEECLKLLPDHDVVTGCAEAEAYEYTKHIYILEAAKRFYEYGVPLSAGSLERLNDQYNKLTEGTSATLTDNGVEIIGAFNAYGFSRYMSLTAEKKAPTPGSALDKMIGEQAECWAVTLTASAGEGSAEPLEIWPGTSVTLKLPLPQGADGENLKVFRLTDAAGVPVEMAYTLVERSGERYILLETDQLGWFALFDEGVFFTDVNHGAWYYDAVTYVAAHGMMQGGGSGLFAPNGELSRAMLAQILYNLENRPAVAAGNAFADVGSGAWYAGAVTWAASNGLVEGYGNGLFGPNDPITREQLAVMLHRYAQYKGMDVSIGEDTDILRYDDAFVVSGWAYPSLQWAVGAKIVQGTTPNTLSPQGQASRAETATMLMRFCEG